MAFTKKNAPKEKAEQNWDYEITVIACRETKNDSILMVDLDVNGVTIKSCILKEIICKNDGTTHKKGDVCYVLNFPSVKSGDKHYNQVWFPLSNANIKDILTQVQSILG